ncbi:hypothetical protein SDC9_202935 [bioreactor metagenome]|uniref:Uncharacterized protein n=1 Tax=bioreactor metagenome TaxID=1076179 RepID=A0A645IV05_9ZZZZ
MFNIEQIQQAHDHHRQKPEHIKLGYFRRKKIDGIQAKDADICNQIGWSDVQVLKTAVKFPDSQNSDDKAPDQ